MWPEDTPANYAEEVGGAVDEVGMSEVVALVEVVEDAAVLFDEAIR